jgi:hypothetical protein
MNSWLRAVPFSVAHFAGIHVDWSTLPTRFPYLFGVLQSVTEDILERCAHRLDVGVQWSAEVIGLQPHSEGVTVAVQGPGGSSTSVWSTWSAATARTARYADSPASRSMGPTGVWSLCWVTWNWRTHREIG